MKLSKNNILTINGGSSSIKFALYQMGDPLKELFQGQLEGIGKESAEISFKDTVTGKKYAISTKIANYNAAADFLVNWLEKQNGCDSVKAIGHRVVNGKSYTEPVEITGDLLNDLSDISIYDPEHLPGEIKLIGVFKKRYPEATQIACFDTEFHASMPLVAKLLPIPYRYYAAGIRRYGFHGLSYAFMMEELKRVTDHKTVHGKIILAHLGNGASLAAVKEGKSVDTSMGFTPTSGLPMGTRCGDMDPGVALYLMKTENLSPKLFNDLINHQSGLLGISGTSADMRDLLKARGTDNHAAEAVDMFCYQTRKWIGSFAAALEGLDTLVFAGGIGENAAEVREQICRGLEFLGIELDKSRNAKNESIISACKSRVCVRVIHTNEQLMIAELCYHVLKHPIKK